MKKTIITLSFAAMAVLADSSVIELSPVSVTATGSEEKVLAQPLSISKKSESEIKLDQVIFQKDLLNSLAGVRIVQTGSVIGNTTSIRMPNNTDSYYLFMQDGIPVQSSGFFNHNGLAYTTFESATSVDVLKGPGTALYGSDAVAAVINVQSVKKPSKQKEITFKGMGGSNGYGSTFLEVSDTVDENSSYRANVNYMHSDGWRDHTNTDRFEANVRYDHKINSDNDVKVIFNTSYTDAEQADTFNDYDNIKNGSTAASDDATYFSALQQTDVRRKFDYARLSAEFTNYSFNDLDISFTPYLRYNRNRYVATWEKNLPSNDNKMFTAGFLQKNKYTTSWGRLIGGVDAEFTKSTLLYNQDFDITTGGKTYLQGAIYDYDVNYMAIAPYIHGEYDITSDLMLSAGLRYDYNQYEYKNNLTADSTDASGVYYRPGDRNDHFSHLSPKLSLNYKINKDTNIYARYANGFRIPQSTLLYSMKAGYENVKLDPETSNTYEIGIKSEMGKKSYTELAAYYMTINDTITKYRDIPSGYYYYDNGGSTTHKGVELTTQIQATDEWAARIAYSYSMHNYVNDSNYGDNEISQAPNNTGNARLVYTPKNIKGLSVMGEYIYVGSYWMDDAHTVDKYKGYGIGNLKADYVYSKHLSLFAKITNITDERYAVSASYAYGKSDYTPGDPRQFYAGLSYLW
ncbi:TonB-dependent receptor [Sulfurimonas sp. HSL-1716]|uniref:TonB-dependent receptor n=1 Tax=Hydrocurvibacter sulfurireducens TaxID=3131937 RepID=UPI0031F74FC4